MRARWLFLAVPLLFLVSCDTPTETTDSTDPNFKKPIPLKQSCYDPDDPLCLPGPSPDDPDPDAPGYFIGPDYNMDHCTQSNDYDDDGFDDNCEYRIARRFAPMLSTNSFDDTSGEPYWVAEYVDEMPSTRYTEGVKVMYLFSYHEDFGISTRLGDYGAHKGDSEFIVLWIGFTQATEHWEVDYAFYAAHHNEAIGDSDFEGSFRFLEYPDHQRGYPRVWVANDKHASYTTRYKCNNGGAGDFDTCTFNNDDRRIDVFRWRNLGSGEHQFVNCVATTESNIYTYPGTECFWKIDDDGYEFCGWMYSDYDRDEGCSTKYVDHLVEFGFWEGIM